MTNILESVDGAIKSANKDLVSFLTTLDKFPHNISEPAKNVPLELPLNKNAVVKEPTNTVQAAERSTFEYVDTLWDLPPIWMFK